MHKSLHTVTNTYIVSLCAADLLYCAGLPLTAYYQLKGTWIYPHWLCPLLFSIETLGKFGGVAFITILAIDRYTVLCRQLQSSKYRYAKYAISIIIGTWAFVLLVTYPIFAFSTVVDGVPVSRCAIMWQTKQMAKMYILATTLFLFFVPFLIITFCYIKVLLTVNAAKARSRRLSMSNATNASSSRANKYDKATRTVLVIVAFYVLCWLPYTIFNLSSEIMPMIDKREPNVLQTLMSYTTMRFVVKGMHLLPYFNAALNPIVYAFCTSEFKQVLQQKWWLVSDNTRTRFSRRQRDAELMAHRKMTANGNELSPLHHPSQMIPNAELLELHSSSISQVKSAPTIVILNEMGRRASISSPITSQTDEKYITLERYSALDRHIKS